MPDYFDHENDNLPPDGRSRMIYGAAFFVGVAILMGIGWYFR
jgi:hypothetical protein